MTGRCFGQNQNLHWSTHGAIRSPAPTKSCSESYREVRSSVRWKRGDSRQQSDAFPTTIDPRISKFPSQG